MPFYLISTVEELTQPTKHTHKILVSIFFYYEGQILDTQGMTCKFCFASQLCQAKVVLNSKFNNNLFKLSLRKIFSKFKMNGWNTICKINFCFKYLWIDFNSTNRKYVREFVIFPISTFLLSFHLFWKKRSPVKAGKCIETFSKLSH